MKANELEPGDRVTMPHFRENKYTYIVLKITPTFTWFCREDNVSINIPHTDSSRCCKLTHRRQNNGATKKLFEEGLRILEVELRNEKEMNLLERNKTLGRKRVRPVWIP